MAANRSLVQPSVQWQPRPALRPARHGPLGPLLARPTLEARIGTAWERSWMRRASSERALYGWGAGGASLAVLSSATYPERTSALLIDGWLAIRWSPDFPWGISPEEWNDYLTRLKSIWGDDDHALEIGQLTCGDRPEDGPWDDPGFAAPTRSSLATRRRQAASRPSSGMSSRRTSAPSHVRCMCRRQSSSRKATWRRIVRSQSTTPP